VFVTGAVLGAIAYHERRDTPLETLNVTFHAAACTLAVSVTTPSMSKMTALISEVVTTGGRSTIAHRTHRWLASAPDSTSWR
jgi:hypothetical protein